MTEATADPRPSDTITAVEGFEAMRTFLASAWQRQGRPSEDIAWLLGRTKWVDGAPADVAIWQEWLSAVRLARLAQTR
jgi:hypothetical protein